MILYDHQHQKVKISRSACQKLILSGLRCMSLSGNWKNKGSSFMLSLEQPIMHHNQRDTNRLQTFKLLGKANVFFKLFFLSFLEIIRSGPGVIQLLHVGIIHKTWAAGSFQRPLHTCMILTDNALINNQSTKQCD